MTNKYIDIVFDGPPAHESGRFVEVEDQTGSSIKFGEWIEREDGYWCLRITGPERKQEDEQKAIKWDLLAECQHDPPCCNCTSCALTDARAENEELKENKKELLASLDAACTEIDSFGFNSDDYGGEDTLASCIRKLGNQRNKLRLNAGRLLHKP